MSSMTLAKCHSIHSLEGYQKLFERDMTSNFVHSHLFVFKVHDTFKALLLKIIKHLHSGDLCSAHVQV